ncbi:MAG: hypothetical protein JWO98_2149 [Frankiales bacterium]|nr:hypothetical protein [Frankiales bacterium]
MKLTLTSPQIEYQHSLRQLLERECTVELVRSLRNPDPAPVPPQLWSALVRVGFLGLPFDGEVGGEGGSLLDLGLAYQEAGRVLCPTDVYSTMAFGLAVDRLADDDVRKDLIGRIAQGQLRGTSALWHPDGELDRPAVQARYAAGRWRLSGRLGFVPNVEASDYLLVAAQTSEPTRPEQTVIVLLRLPAEGVTSSRVMTFGRDSQFTVDLRDVAVTDDAVISRHDAGSAEAGSVHWLRNADLALRCAEMVGGAQAVLERTLDYVRTRHQFGRPIGGFQAVQHQVADVRIGVDGARLATYQALWWLAEGELAERFTVIAKACCNEAYKRATLTAHQLHGGMGYLRETDLHLWSERAKVTELTGGAVDVQMRRLAGALGLGATA